ncbi:MAG: NAD(P)/FAD-dependent oxidoreductase [Lachnospiraceae bacterium]|nr:NAD(P)/FAD-dependent oxidoreductase [Lachnospiraceae bacterium]
MRQTIIIGGGAAGMMAAIVSAREGDGVELLEHTDTLGKKLLSTGNGRCNLTNKNLDISCYHSEHLNFPLPALKQFGYKETLRFFGELGLFFKERNGYLYPRASQASAVREALLSELSRLGVRIRTGCKVTEILKKADQSFLIRTEDMSFFADALVLACGGKAAPFTGSDGSGYPLAVSLGHRLIPPVPALTGLLAASSPFRKAAGVRTDGRVSLYVEENGKQWFMGADTGEIQLTDSGISGIPVFQVSRHAARALAEKKRVFAKLDFLPEYHRAKVETYIQEYGETGNEEAERLLLNALEKDGDCFRILCGLFPEKLVAVFLKKAGIPLHAPSGRVERRKKQILSKLVCQFPLEITAVNDFTKAQVTAGGIDTRQVQANTMESIPVPGLYFAGEILDVDGICGGYNLQWAWASGFLAGKQGRP